MTDQAIHLCQSCGKSYPTTEMVINPQFIMCLWCTIDAAPEPTKLRAPLRTPRLKKVKKKFGGSVKTYDLWYANSVIKSNVQWAIATERMNELIRSNPNNWIKTKFKILPCK